MLLNAVKLKPRNCRRAVAKSITAAHGRVRQAIPGGLAKLDAGEQARTQAAKREPCKDPHAAEFCVYPNKLIDWPGEPESFKDRLTFATPSMPYKGQTGVCCRTVAKPINRGAQACPASNIQANWLNQTKAISSHTGRRTGTVERYPGCWVVRLPE